MIDALDEAPIGRKDSIGEEITELARKYPNCPILLTSRPSDEFVSWENFTTAHLQPFSKHQCIEYINKIDFDHEKKTEFLDALENELFSKHTEFLSNPLLAAMMLLTYDEYGEIPARRHVFFEKCFQVLLREHDVSKSRYRREFHSGLDYLAIESVLQYFCVLTYLERKFSFKHKELVSFIQDSLEGLGYDVSAESFLQDLSKSVCILQKDGDYYEFVHRSFQEYFYSRFVVSDRRYSLEEKLKEFLKVDDVIDMVIDMDRNYFEINFLLPRVQKLNRIFSKIDPFKKPDLIINKFFARCYCARRKDDEHDVPEVYIGYSVSHNDDEYSPRGLNLLSFKYLSDHYNYLRERSYVRDTPTKETILETFGIDEDDLLLQRLDGFLLIQRNRQKLVKLNSGTYAQHLKKSFIELQNKVEDIQRKRENSLSEKLKKRLS